MTPPFPSQPSLSLPVSHHPPSLLTSLNGDDTSGCKVRRRFSAPCHHHSISQPPPLLYCLQSSSSSLPLVVFFSSLTSVLKLSLMIV
ncbi:uncharacterized protein DS421_18g614110 [Arachis hypogaea]|nr:uncharacterized protein DS421_18g614110 [Arachis hypogaea]